MNMILWGIFYLVTAAFLIYFFVKEKEVIDFIRKKEDILIQKIPVDEGNKGKREMIGNLITLMALAVTIAFFFIVDRTPDPSIRIKNWGIYGTFLLNLGIFILREQHEWVFMGNVVMIFLGKLMFNILDNSFYIFLGINAVLSIILIFLFRKPAREEINERFLIEEMKGDRKNKDRKIQIENIDEAVEVEKRKRSSLGKAFARMDTAVTAILLVMLIQTFYLGNYVIPTGSMEETIKIQDRVFANMIKYKFSAPKVNDIVAFKEPITDKVMYTKRLTGAAGQTLQIKDIQEQELADPSIVSDFGEFRKENVHAGSIYHNDVKAGKLGRPYTPEGLMQDTKIYIPKKGDKVRIEKIIMMPRMVVQTDRDNFISRVEWRNYSEGNFEELTPQQFLERIGTRTGFKDIIGNDEGFAGAGGDMYYTFFLKAEGREEAVLPIMDFKYNDELFLKLLNGEWVTLDTDYYMAMGDNTLNSLDSRFFGYVSEDRIKGELLIRWWPINRIGFL